MKLTARQIGEYDSRDFHGEETWKRWKQDYDRLMSFRKSLKGKPNGMTRLELALNDQMIEGYDFQLFHSSMLQRYDRCVCGRCSRLRAGITDEVANEKFKQALNKAFEQIVEESIAEEAKKRGFTIEEFKSMIAEKEAMRSTRQSKRDQLMPPKETLPRSYREQAEIAIGALITLVLLSFLIVVILGAIEMTTGVAIWPWAIGGIIGLLSSRAITNRNIPLDP